MTNVWNGKMLTGNDGYYELASEMWTNPISASNSCTIGFIGTKSEDVTPSIDDFIVSSVFVNYDFEGNDDSNESEYEDSDNDGLLNHEETYWGTNQYDCDTDNDGFLDNYEIIHGMNPLEFDELSVDASVLAEISDSTIDDLSVLNLDEYYPLEVVYADGETQVKSISGVFSEITVNNPNEAIYSLYNVKTLVGLVKPKEELKLTNVNRSASGTTYTFNQYYNGMRVLGNTITISVDNEGKTTSLHSSVINRTLIEENIEDSSILTENEIAGIINSMYPNVQNQNTEHIIYSEEYGKDFCHAYLSEITLDTMDNLLVVFNANSGSILKEFSASNNAMTTSSGLNETGVNVTFPVNEDIKYEGKLNSSFQLVFYPKTKTYTMEDTNRDIYMYDMNNDNKKYKMTEDMTTATTPVVWSDASAISTYQNVITVYDWWQSKYGYKGLNGTGGKVKIYMHDSTLNNNASYTWSIFNESIHFGDYTSFAMAGMSKGGQLDCVGHEYTHGVVRHKTSDLFAYSDKIPGTINEAYADIFGSFINSNTWRTSPRDISNPNSTNNPSKVSDSHFLSDFSEEHKNSTVISHAAYLMESKYKIPFDKLHDLWYDSLSEGYDIWSDLYTVRTNVIKSARKNNFTYDEISAIKSAFDDVEIYEDKGNVEITILDGDVAITSAKVTLINYGIEKVENITSSSSGIAAFSDVEIGTNTVKIEIQGYEPIYTQILVKKNKTATKTIKLITSLNFNSVDYEKYDHYNYFERYSTSLAEHIVFQGNNIQMLGYSSDPLKDFILIKDDVSSMSTYKQVLLSFNIERDANDWHTMEGGGFLFNASVSDDNTLSGYCALVTQQGLKLYYIADVDVDMFRDGKLGNISNVGELLGTYDIGNVLDNHEITLRIVGKKITLWDGNKIIIDNYKLPYNTKSYDFGPITSHISHACSQISYFTFSDITMNVISESK